MMAEETIRDIQVLPGVEPINDCTPHSTQHYTFTDKIRFHRGFAEKIGGNEAVTIINGVEIEGCSRGIYSYFQGGAIRYLVGTNARLYYFDGRQLFNVTPLNGVDVSIPDAFTTNYENLADNPVVTVVGQSQITIIDFGTHVRTGDYITLIGLTDTGGVPSEQLNTVHFATANDGKNFFIN